MWCQRVASTEQLSNSTLGRVRNAIEITQGFSDHVLVLWSSPPYAAPHLVPCEGGVSHAIGASTGTSETKTSGTPLTVWQEREQRIQARFFCPSLAARSSALQGYVFGSLNNLRPPDPVPRERNRLEIDERRLIMRYMRGIMQHYNGIGRTKKRSASRKTELIRSRIWGPNTAQCIVYRDI